LSRRIRDAEKSVHRLVEEDKSNSSDSETRGHRHSLDVETQQAEDLAQDEGSDGDLTDDEDESLDGMESRFHELEDEVATLVADVHDLALYTKLNITGFYKILKVRFWVTCDIISSLTVFTET
jgi:hypothetical protein